MFSRSDLDSLDSALLIDWRYMGSYPGLHYAVFPQHAFRVPDSEQTIRITRAPKRSGDNGLQFWVSAECANSPSGNYDQSTRDRRAEKAANYFRGARFRNIDEVEFNSIVRGQCTELLIVPNLPLHEPQGFIGAISIRTLETELVVSLVAEYADEFIHFYWESTA
jgi:hypothetical protein